MISTQTSRPIARTNVEYEENSTGAMIPVENSGEGQVTVRGVRSLAAEKLLQRSWSGLGSDDVTSGEEAAILEVGRDGVARGISDWTGEDLS